jgi:hypothetical protein
MTDETLAAAVARIVTAVHETLPKLKISASDIVRIMTDAEWEKVKGDEDQRRLGAVAALTSR